MMDEGMRFWAKVDKREDGCWLWTASLDRHGYGEFRTTARRTVRAHRWAYEYANGPIGDGLHMDHLCRNRACVNPAHLEPVTQQENIRRGEGGAHWAAKTHCPQGHPYSGPNLLLSHKPGGGAERRCRACHYARTARYAAGHKEQRAAWGRRWRAARSV